MRRWIGLLLLTGLMMGCQSGAEYFKRESDKLIDTLKAYEITVRWNPLEKMYGYLKPDPENPTEIPEDLDQIKVSHYEVLNAPQQVAEHKIVQTVRIQYLRVDQQVIRKITDQQVWEYDKELKRWYRTNPIPAFK